MQLAKTVSVLLLIPFLYIAIGSATEISNRDGVYRSLREYVNWLEYCSSHNEKICNGHDVEAERPNVEKQKSNFDQLNANGNAGNPCGVSKVIAAPYAGLTEDCLQLSGMDMHRQVDPANAPRLEDVLHPGWVKLWGFIRFDELGLGMLYFLLAMAWGGLGSQAAVLHMSGTASAGPLLMGVPLGLLGYALLVVGAAQLPGNVQTVFGGPNPLAVAFVAALFGMFSDKAFEVLEKAIGIIKWLPGKL